MSRSIRSTSRGRIAALGRAVIALVTVLAMLAPSVAWAGTPYNIHWVDTQDPQSCGIAELEHEGDAMFRVNDTPLPTYDLETQVPHPDGSTSSTAEAPFDSVLLQVGTNDFFFEVHASSGDDSCIHAHEVVNLISAPLGLNKPLFNVRRDARAFSGNTTADLSLQEINPQLARSIADLEVAIERWRKSLIENASKVADLAAKESLLQDLDLELHDLVKRPLDEIAQTDLDAILDRYAEVVDPATKAALEQLINDLKQSVTDLQYELASLIDNFGAQADEVADLATGAARGEGFNPDDPSSYALGPGEVPWVDVPDISNVPGAFNSGNDPYVTYADKVIAALEADVSAGKVIARADFVANVRAWRTNEAALEKALQQRMGVSLAETNAFLNAQNRVTTYVRHYMDVSDWFVDTPVPVDLRAYVDGVLKHAFSGLSDQMKDSLNLWEGDTLDLEQSQLYQTIDAFAGAMSAIGDGAQAYVDVMGTFVHATSRIAIGFVPYVGPALDLCEAITGKSWCLPSGKELNTEERIFSGVGFAVASIVPAWRGVKDAGVSPAATLVADEVSRLGEELAMALSANRRTWYKTLRGAVTTNAMNAFERKAALYLMKDEERALIGVGDDGVRKVLGIPKDAPGNLAKAPDFVSMTKGGKLALSEAKGIVSDAGVVDVSKAIAQLTNAMKKVAEKGLAGDVARVEIIIPKGTKLATNYGTKDGYLFLTVEGKAFAIDGFPRLFIKVVEL